MGSNAYRLSSARRIIVPSISRGVLPARATPLCSAWARNDSIVHVSSDAQEEVLGAPARVVARGEVARRRRLDLGRSPGTRRGACAPRWRCERDGVLERLRLGGHGSSWWAAAGAVRRAVYARVPRPVDPPPCRRPPRSGSTSRYDAASAARRRPDLRRRDHRRRGRRPLDRLAPGRARASRPVVLESRTAALGASGRNGGFLDRRPRAVPQRRPWAASDATSPAGCTSRDLRRPDAGSSRSPRSSGCATCCEQVGSLRLADD